MKTSLKFVKKYLILPLSLVALVSAAQAVERKDCRLHIVASTLNSAGNALVYVEAENKHLAGDTTKSRCLDNDKIKDSACDGLRDACSTTTTALGPAGVASGWVQWGTSREDCPFRCSGFNTTNFPNGFHNYANANPSAR